MNYPLWYTWFSGTLMPEGCTYEQFVAARNKLWEEEDVALDIKMLYHYREMLAWTTEFRPKNKQLLKLLAVAIEKTERSLANAGL